jgi:hypothetical protein
MFLNGVLRVKALLCDMFFCPGFAGIRISWMESLLLMFCSLVSVNLLIILFSYRKQEDDGLKTGEGVTRIRRA